MTVSEEVNEHIISILDILEEYQNDDLFIIHELAYQLKEELDNLTDE